MKNQALTRLFLEFYGKLASGGALLVLCAIISMLLANSGFAKNWLDFWNTQLNPHLPGLHAHSITHWINDGLMTIFFLLVGLEIERELLVGELSDRRTAMLPVMAAVGGMLVPALLFWAVNINHPEFWRGTGIPTATDIAFAMAIMSALGNRVPASLKVFLTALAIMDDLGAVLVIAIFYGQGLHWIWLITSFVIFGILLACKRTGIQTLWFYLPVGVILWYSMMQSGIHATISGVLLAFAIPFGKKEENVSPSSYLMEKLHEPVALFILPLFALANTAIPISSDTLGSITGTLPLGIAAGLVLGKPMGIYLASVLSVKMNVARLPTESSFKHILGAGLLGGIGFTMAIFVANLAFNDAASIELSKLAVLISSVIAAIVGYTFLRLIPKQ
ncbi:MAG: Na+/H+ antiporter NhaA [Bacteroidetes bacterium]|nr:Na+/H+ antiporter NhaA [Bacteroidota bacterium]